MFTPELPASIDDVRIDTLEFWTASAEERIHGIKRMPCAFTPGGA